MSKVKSTLQSLLRSPALPLYLFWVLIAIAHIFFPTNMHDDSWFMQILAGDKATFGNWLDFLIGRYHEWSSRIVIEGLLIVMVRWPWLWKICDTAILVLISILFTRIANPEKSLAKNLILIFSMLVYPVAVIYEVGFVATSLNYTWPFTAALFAITPAIKEFQGREVKKWEYIAACPALFLACFQELICAVLVLVLLGSILYRAVWQRKTPKYQLACLAICIIMLIFALTCPGNDNRTMLETADRLPEYANLSLFQKVELGFSSMIKMIFLNRNIFVLIFCVVLAVSVFLESKKLWHRIIACIPPVFVFCVGTIGLTLEKHLPFLEKIRYAVGPLGTGFTLLDPKTWAPDVIFVLIFVIWAFSLRFIVKDTKKYAFWFFVMLLGVASRVALGLSPTVWASGERIFAFLYVSMAAVMSMLIHRAVLRFSKS